MSPETNGRPTPDEAVMLLLDAQRKEEECRVLRLQIERQLQDLQQKLDAAQSQLLDAVLATGRVRFSLQQWGYRLPEIQDRLRTPSNIDIDGSMFLVASFFNNESSNYCAP